MFYFKLYDKEKHRVYHSSKDTLFLLESTNHVKRVFKYDFTQCKIEEIPYATLLWGTKIGNKIIYDRDLFALNDLKFEVRYITESNGFYLIDLGTNVTASLTNSLFTTLLLSGVKYVGNAVLLSED